MHLDLADLRRAGADADELDKIRPFDPAAPYLRAELALAQARWDAAESQAGEATRRLGTAVDRPLEVAIALVRAAGLNGGGHPREALRVFDEVAPMLDRSRRALLQIRARVCHLRAQALLGSCPGAAPFQDLLGAAKRLGIPALGRDVERAGGLLRVKCGTAAYAVRRD